MDALVRLFLLFIIQAVKQTSQKYPNHLRNYKTPVNFQTLGRKRLLTLLTHPSTGAKPPQNRPTHSPYLKYLLSRKYPAPQAGEFHSLP